MSEQKGLGSKLLGIFVETDEARTGSQHPGEEVAGREKTPAEIVAELAGQTAPGSRKPVAPGKKVPHPPAEEPSPALKLDKVPPPPATGPMDFDAIFKTSGMDAAELDRVKKAEDLLRSLPEATPQPVKKQIVEASLKAFGFEIEKIVLAAQNQKKALDAYVRVNENATAKAIQDAEAQIRALNEKISGLRADIEKRTTGLTSLSASAQGRKADVQKVIDFFQGPTTAAPGAT